MGAPRFVASAIALLIGAATTTSACAEDFYQGKTLTIVVGFTTGGGFDANARLLSRHIGRHIPGNPDVVVSNMPGAASMTSVLYLDSAAAKDGTVLNIFNFGEVGNARMGVSHVNVDFRKFNWIGSVSRDVTVCYLWRALGIPTLDEAKKRGKLHFSLTAVGTSNDVNQRILKNIIGLDLQQVNGYPGSAEEKLAIERGEIDGNCGSWASTPADWLAGDKIVPITRSGPTPAGMSPTVPFIVDLVPDKDREVVRFLAAATEVLRPFIMSAAVPPDRAAILRAGFDATMGDPQFLAEAAKQKLPISPMTAAETKHAVDEIYGASDATVTAARKIAGE